MLGVDADADDYLDTIKPVLKERCFACHGALKQKSKLRLDTVAAMHKKGIIEDGELLARLTDADPDERMPPEGEPLHAHEVKLIKEWIAAGAPAPQDEKPEDDPSAHWAFQRIERPAISGDGNLIDAYFAARHADKGLVPQPQAARTLLLRRLYLDLIGLPPTVEQLAATASLPEIIDSLLASPHYGERWGRHWMDVWRYSDGYGLAGMLRDSQKHMWHWREWIVKSLNSDKGYDQMIREMLAADETAPADLEAIAATGFLARNYYLFNRTTWLDNTIEHTSKAFVGLTMNCAKCHDHKYDPIDHSDYYRFRAIFEPHHVRLDALPGESDYNKNALPRAYDDRLAPETFVHRRGDPSQPIEDKPISPGPPVFLSSFAAAAKAVELPLEAWAPGTRDYVQRDRLAAAEGLVATAREALAQVPPELEAPVAEPATGVALQDDFRRADPERWKMVGQGWRYQGGLLAQTEVTKDRAYLRSKAPHPRNFSLALTFRTTGGDRWKSTGISFDISEDGENAHTVYASAAKGESKVQLAHKIKGRKIYPDDAKRNLSVNLNQDYTLTVQVRDRLVNVSLDEKFLFAYTLPKRQDGGTIEVFAFDATADFMALDLHPLSPDLALQPASNKTAEPAGASTDLAAARLAAAEAGVAALKARIAADNGGAKAEAGRLQLLATVARAEADLLRGDAGKVGKARQAKKRAESALAKGEFPDHKPLRGSERALDQKTHKASQYPPTYPKTSTGRRRALAEWITHRDNPLTARVAVNHIWMRHFGTPLVPSVFDFGRRAPKPPHQALLDALAVELIESGWSMKHLHRLILSAAAWQRNSSNHNADSATFAADPQNAEYWRMNSRRMESQVVRDSLLHLSGALDLSLGGPSLKPSPNGRRRSLYFLHSRDDKLLFLSAFDDADIFGCYRRNESIVPQQALAVMNSKLAIDSAARLAASLDVELANSDYARAAFQRVLARDPAPDELAACIRFLQAQPKRARFIHALLNHNDFVTIR
jgi:hypothetical protein